MVSIVTAILACVFGFMLYTLIPVVAMGLPITIRERVGTFYLKLGAKCLKQFTFVRRVLSGYDILPINVDDEQKLLKVTLSSSTVGENSEYRFNDPDNRISRLFSKPVALAYENVPAAVDADLAEWGYWVRQKETDEGLWHGEEDDPESVRVDPYVETDDKPRLVDPMDVFELVSNDVDSENVKTAEEITKERFSEYDSGMGLTRTIRMLIFFSVGAGSVLVFQYANRELMSGGGGGGGGMPVVGNQTLSLSPDPGLIMDAVVMLA